MATFGTIEVYEEMAAALNGSDAWLETGRALTYSVAFTYRQPVGKTFFLRFESGKVTDVHEVDPAHPDVADFSIAAAPKTWRAILEGKTKPMTAVTLGKLKIDGDFGALMTHMKAFSTILDAMADVELV